MERINVLKKRGCEDLANAIIEQAALDYKAACKRLKKGDRCAMREIKKLEDFFNSTWGDFLCEKVNATDILKRLQKEEGV